MFPQYARLSVLALGLALAAPSSANARGKADSCGKPGKKECLPEVTFTGFRAMPDGRAVVFVELTSVVPITVHKDHRTVEYTLSSCRVPVRNNTRPLLTGDFASSVASARLVPGKDSVKLVIRLDADVEPQHRVLPRGKGAVLEVSVPAASSASPPPAQ